jgi:hypothetical protein
VATTSSNGARSVLDCYVDEAGDPNLFTRRGTSLVGTRGCSNYFILGELEVTDPDGLGKELEDLRAQLMSDPHFRDVPSLRPDGGKTALAFHATDDIPEVRSAVFHVLMRHQISFFAVVRDKRKQLEFECAERRFQPGHRYTANALYDDMVAYLFSGLHEADKQIFWNLHGTADEVHICFASRGSKGLTQALRAALDTASGKFHLEFGFPLPRPRVWADRPPGNACLQATDYFLWALQRFYERNEERYLSYVWPRTVEVHEVCPFGIRLTYTADNPLTLKTKQRDQKYWNRP